ncbi:hypothetical protein ACOJCM_03545 [Billgrantia sp. LNSP4103-1]|uniref:hypothetical protein n=1 Tax=Billgrantia sp. LNSP4103-1 TaxID=3410266 RepID=UPI00403F1FB2
MDHDLTDHQVEILSRALQHGGVLAAPFGHPGEDSLVDEMEAQAADLEAGGLVKAWRDENGSLQRLEVTSQGYAALGVR